MAIAINITLHNWSRWKTPIIRVIINFYFSWANNNKKAKTVGSVDKVDFC